MDDKGRFIITENGREKFVGKTFEETGVADELRGAEELAEAPVNRHDRRKLKAQMDRLQKQLSRQST